MAITIFPGDIIIVNNHDGNFLSSAIQFFTKSWSHTAIGFFPIKRKENTVQTVFEANLTTGITDWDKTFDYPKYDLRIYRWTKDIGMEKIVWELFDSYNGNTYGWWQLLWFIWRWIVEGLRFPTRWARKNFFNNREICSEVVYVALEKLNNPTVNAALERLDRDQNTVHPGDIIFICEDLCSAGLLELIYNRE